MQRYDTTLRWLAVVMWASFIFFLSSQEELPRPGGFSIDAFSIIGHFGAYFVLSALLVFAFRGSGIAVYRAALLAVVISALYGISDEWHQSFVPGRDPSPLDFVIDLLAAVTAGIASVILTNAGRRIDIR